jgi:antitoxin HicB
MATVRRNGRKVRRAENPAWPGYQVTVPLLPGVITYGRTLAEAREMARDAIRCHIEGLRKDGERIPDEKNARKEKLRVALSA